jgi:hypothetical protein
MILLMVALIPAEQRRMIGSGQLVIGHGRTEENIVDCRQARFVDNADDASGSCSYFAGSDSLAGQLVGRGFDRVLPYVPFCLVTLRRKAAKGW